MIQAGINQFIGLLAANARTKEMVASKEVKEKRASELHTLKTAQISQKMAQGQQLHESNLKTQKLAQKQLRIQNKAMMNNPELIREIAMSNMSNQGKFLNEQRKSYTANAGGEE